MDTKRYTPEIVVNENLTFSIPLYQRLFAWGEKQVEGLLKDLYEHFKLGESPYYLGMLSCIDNKGKYDLIDGQQRLTVMTLMGIVLRQFYPRWNDFILDGKRVGFIARTKDKEYLAAKIAGVAAPEINAKMDLAVGVINGFMFNPDYFQNDEERNVYAERVYKYLSFYFSNLPLEYLKEPTSLNKYFEAMNAHGKSLEQHEILKVELMKGEPDKEYLTKVWNAVSEMGRPIIRKNSDEDPIDVHRQAYKDALELCREGKYDVAFHQYCSASYDVENNDTIGAIEPEKPQPVFPFTQDESSDKSIISFQEFLLLVLDISQRLNGKYSFYRKDLITAFKDHKIADIRQFYHNLLFCRLLLDYYIITKEDGKYGNRYAILYKDDSDNDGRKRKSVIQYQSMLYVSQTPIYEWLKPLLVNLMQNQPTGCSIILQWLKDTDDAYRKLPENVEEMSYKNGVDRYWFWRLDYYLWENRAKYFKEEEDREIVDEYVFRANRSIEHLHPKHQEHNSEWDESDVHTFGNLAMISQSFNSEQSDDPVTVKFARILDQANNHSLQSIKMYKMYLEAEKSPGGWTADKMHKHQLEMYELLKSSYIR